ncbi:MAG: hypothetical protein P1V51_01505 [Deltaproteobacteria bacterium]|nr:hypothetical protein [Deltaproteobacteria bacterium]
MRAAAPSSLLALLFLAACGPPAPEEFERLPLADPLPDFALEDVNPASASHGLSLGPSHLRGKVSAWYFGHST